MWVRALICNSSSVHPKSRANNSSRLAARAGVTHTICKTLSDANYADRDFLNWQSGEFSQGKKVTNANLRAAGNTLRCARSRYTQDAKCKLSSLFSKFKGITCVIIRCHTQTRVNFVLLSSWADADCLSCLGCALICDMRGEKSSGFVCPQHTNNTFLLVCAKAHSKSASSAALSPSFGSSWE